METKRAGRKTKHFIDSNGDQVKGLSRRPDGRWRIIGTQTTFREPDEAKAIERFRRMTSSPARQAFATLTLAELLPQLPMILAHPEAWPIVGEVIRQRPVWCAKASGIEQLGYLTDLKPPQPSTPVETITKTWDLKPASKKQKAKDLAAWTDFIETTGIETLKEITPAVAVAFRDKVYSRNLNGKTQSHIFGGIRRVLKFTRSRAIAMEEISSALGSLALLTPNGSTQTIDPQPIERSDFTKLLATAEGDTKAMVLLMLNCAMYLQEVVRVRWEDIADGCLITHRAKKGKCVRIAVLWPETLAALAQVQRRGEYVFYSNEAAPLTVSGASKRFRKLRTDAKVSSDVKAEHLRDGAITAAAQANIEERLCKLLEGHRTHGVTDKYAKRQLPMPPQCP